MENLESHLNSSWLISLISADYPQHLLYEIVRSDKPEKGLEWLLRPCTPDRCIGNGASRTRFYK